MKSEPVLTAATISGVLVALAAIFNVVLDTGTVETIIVAVLPVLLSLFGRARVTPVKR
jgi:hypothetical protein